jgi:hypothetical protein
MNFTEIIIVYLALGSPFGVYYYLQNRSIIKAICVLLLWIPFAFTLLQGKVTNLLTKDEFVENFKSVSVYKKQIEQYLSKNLPQFSIFEIREVLERYIGLTLSQQESNEIGKNETEVFQIAESKNIKLGGICLHRRNQTKLNYHQTLARRDFLKLINECVNFADRNKIYDCAMQIATILDDIETEKAIKNLQRFPQKYEPISVQTMENDLWNSKLQPNNVQSKMMQTSSMMKTMSIKD